MGVHTWFYKRGFKSEKEFNPIRQKVKGHWYVEETKRPIPLKTEHGEVVYYHDLFRFHTEEDIYLLSEKECMEFIKKHNITDVQWDDLKEFWKVYPDGMITFV